MHQEVTHVDGVAKDEEIRVLTGPDGEGADRKVEASAELLRCELGRHV
jgi:hypothetical protein